jgi:hypothetical protein
MYKTLAIIVKKGSKWCVRSEDGTRNFGCFDTKNDAINRLQQIEYFKVKGMSYQDIFDNLGKTLGGSVNNISPSTTKKGGTIAGKSSIKLLDNREHFPIITEAQAISTLSRASKLSQVPYWYSGTLPELRQEVYSAIQETHPSLIKSVALSDGQTAPELKKAKIKNPADVVDNKAAPAKRPSMAAEVFSQNSQDENSRKILATQLNDAIEKHRGLLDEASKVAQRLGSSGLSAQEFEALPFYIQEEALKMVMTSNNSIARRSELLEKLKKNED